MASGPASRSHTRQSARDIGKQPGAHEGRSGCRPLQDRRVAGPRGKIVACDVSENGSPARRGNVHMGLLPTSAPSGRKPSSSRASGRQALDAAISTFEPNTRAKENTDMVGGTPRARDKRATLQRKNRSIEAGAAAVAMAEKQISAFPVNTLGDEALKENAPVWPAAGEASKERAQTFAAGRPFNAPELGVVAQRRRPALQISTGASTEAAGVPDAGRLRSATLQPSPLSGRMSRYRGSNLVAPDPTIPQEEMPGMLERLFKMVHDSRVDVMAKSVFSSPRTPTRFDLDGQHGAARRSPSGASVGSAGTVDTVRLSGSDAGGEGQGPAQEVYSPRRRAVTVGPAGAERGASEVRRRLSGEAGGARAYSSSVSEVRRKIERVRARRAAQLASQAQDPAASPPVGSPASPSSRAGWQSLPATLSRPRLVTGLSGSTAVDDDSVFFEGRGTRAMFQEVTLAVKDVEWDKRVYYYHAAQANEALRRLNEEAEVRDCREECLVDLLGRRGADRVLGGQRAADDEGGGYLAESEVDAVAEWMDAASDWSDAEEQAHRSFDWSRDGFGYMEFRRPSKASLTAVSPGVEPRQLGSLMSPLHSRPSEEAIRSPAERLDSVAAFAVPMDGGSARAVRPLRGTLGEQQQRRRRRPATMFDLGAQGRPAGGLARISEGGDAEEDVGVPAVGRRAARQQLQALRRANEALREDVVRARNAVRALTRLYALAVSAQERA